MKTIYITGHSGFVGKNLIDEFKSQFIFTKHVKGNDFLINEEIVIHLAGKAHDLKKVADDKEYYEVNTELTKNVFNSFMKSDAKVFIFLAHFCVNTQNDVDIKFTPKYIKILYFI